MKNCIFVTESNTLFKVWDDRISRIDNEVTSHEPMINEPFTNLSGDLIRGHCAAFALNNSGDVLTTMPVVYVSDRALDYPIRIYNFVPQKDEHAKIKYISTPCKFCNTQMQIIVPAEDYCRWGEELAQYVFNYLSSYQLDILITSICISCQIELGV